MPRSSGNVSLPIVSVDSPNGGSTYERRKLSDRFTDRLSVNTEYSRRIVSYQGNRNVPGLRWMKYKEGFSHELVAKLISDRNPQAVLDPFAGICTTPLVAAGSGSEAMGIEIMPVGTLTGEAIAHAANGVSSDSLSKIGNEFIGEIQSKHPTSESFAFPHVRITEGAFSAATEAEIARARRFLSRCKDEHLHSLLNIACVSVLEESSFTRKDGQYLRWDSRSGRSLRSRMNKGPIAGFGEALKLRLSQMVQDVDILNGLFGGPEPKLISGSSLELLRDIPSQSFDMVITSPPYANRYDYTRTYALELAWMGYDQRDFSALRQDMLSATVENTQKLDRLNRIYRKNRETLDAALDIYQSQGTIQEVTEILTEHVTELSNRNVIRLIHNYFLEMALVVAELGRIVRPGGVVVMVNDNVQYHGEELPVDFILADFAEQSGFECSNIWMLVTGKGNSSQQMARFGRRELRKCVYKWVR